ncbi:MAG: undecaprenyl-diphosphate phosphatase [bacterium]|nr:undecaprenyl-diphosphate phosphatase [bacterium]
MNIIQAIILGIVEGITEFLPISSTAHLIIASKLFHIPQTDFQKFFEVYIQSGAILAVFLLYIKYVMKHKEVIKNVIISFFPTAIVGFLFYKVIKTVFFESTLLIIGAMILFGIVFLVTEYLIKSKKLVLKKSLNKVTWKEAFIIGLNQSLAVVPGVSRAGIVMISMMGLGYKRSESAMYSFLLAVPTIVVASGYDLFKMRGMLIHSTQYLPVLMIGFVASFITAYIAIKWLVGFLQKSSLVPFGIYRIILGLTLLFI